MKVNYRSLFIIVILIVTVIIIYLLNNNKFNSLIYFNLNDKQLSFKITLEDMADILEDNKIDYFLACGTSLGCHRENKFIEHDKDIDLGIFEDVSYKTIVEVIDNSENFSFVGSYPIDKRRPFNKKPEYKLDSLNELCLIHNKTKIKIDIFKYMKRGNKYLSVAYGGKCSNKPRNRCEWLNPINLIKMEFLGRTYNVPDINYIESRYGLDWRIPKVESYDVQSSIIN